MDQFSLFGDGDGSLTPPERQVVDHLARARKTLGELLGRLRAASEMPLTEREARMWRTVAPQMANWLPAHEADDVRREFSREMDRLQGA